MFRFGVLLAFLPLLSACISSKGDVVMHSVDGSDFHRQPVIELGLLVNTAYTLFDNGAGVNPAFPVPFASGFTPIMNLQAKDKSGESDVVFYGHLSQKSDSPGTLVISIRGTSDVQEWIDDAKFFKVPYSKDKTHGNVELGFKEVFSSMAVSHPDQSDVVPLNQYLSTLRDVNRIIVVGHSLGASLATLVAFDASLNNYANEVELVTFASPLTGDKTFVNAFEARINKSLRIANAPDLVPRVPPKLFGFHHVRHELEINSHDFANLKHSLVCYHNLLTYLTIMSNQVVAPEPKCQVK